MKSQFRLGRWLLLSLFLALAGFSTAQERQPDPNQPNEKLPDLLKAKPLKVDPKDDDLRKLLKERYNAVVDEIKSLYEMFLAGRGTVEQFADAGKRLVQSGQ